METKYLKQLSKLETFIFLSMKTFIDNGYAEIRTNCLILSMINNLGYRRCLSYHHFDKYTMIYLQTRKVKLLAVNKSLDL